MPSQPDVRVFDTRDQLFQGAAQLFAGRAADAVKKNGQFSVALAGGSTPKGLYQLLASDSAPSVPWDKTYFFFGDERHVGPDDPESNYRMAREALLYKVPEKNVFRIRAEQDAESAARDYEQTLRTFFHLAPGELPRFDLVLLGTGPDGHTASLFPGTTAVQEEHRLVVANWVEKFKTYRITLTFPVLNHAGCVVFLATGADKTTILREVLENPSAGLPSQRVRPTSGELIWMIDRAAAGELSLK